MPNKMNKHEKRAIITLATFLAACEFADKVSPNPEERQKLIRLIYNDYSAYEKHVIDMFDQCFEHANNMLNQSNATIQ